MKILGVFMALLLLRVESRSPNTGTCVHNYCYTVHTETVDFNSALERCDETGGSLMSVRTREVNEVLLDLLTGFSQHFWIGLRHRGHCTETPSDMKGYSWVTGAPTSQFTNWKNNNFSVCSPLCVSLSKADPTWTESHCTDTRGYLCEYTNDNKCEHLTSQSDVLYETPLGFSKQNLIEVPHGTNATRQDLRTKHLCFDGFWQNAPWTCEVFNGGCEHICVKQNVSICTCQPGYKLHTNRISCVKAENDPCKHAGCSFACKPKGQSYECLCPDGVNLGNDGKTCKDIDHCGDQRACPGKNVQCVKTNSGFECQCRDGFKKVGGICEDIDECNVGPCEYDCVNTEGSYHCECPSGYKVSSEDKEKCTLYCEHNECPAVDCDPNKPFQCDCPRGFIIEERPTGLFCVDIDECDIYYCDQICENTAGGYICSCHEGFILVNNTTCVYTSGGSVVTTVQPTNRTPSEVSAGSLLAITACTVLAVLLTVCLTYHIMKCYRRMDNFTLHKDGNEDMHSLQQVTAEKYTKHCPSEICISTRTTKT